MRAPCVVRMNKLANDSLLPSPGKYGGVGVAIIDAPRRPLSKTCRPQPVRVLTRDNLSMRCEHQPQRRGTGDATHIIKSQCVAGRKRKHIYLPQMPDSMLRCVLEPGSTPSQKPARVDNPMRRYTHTRPNGRLFALGHDCRGCDQQQSTQPRASRA